MADINGSNGNDFLFLNGQVGQLSIFITNAYSGETLYIDDEYNINLSSYDGLGGVDTLFLTDIGDAIFLVSNGNQMLFNIERIFAGDGGDLILLDSTEIVLGDLFIDGGRGDDIIWGNAGNDTIRGFDGNDIIDGGPGNDNIQGQAGDDILRGGDGNDLLDGGIGNDILYGDAGNDRLLGGNGNDILYGGSSFVGHPVAVGEGQSHTFTNSVTFPNLQETVSILNLVPPGTNALGIAAGDLSVSFETTATISFVSTGASYNNSLGFYNIGQDGTIYGVTLAFPNVKDYAAGDSATITLPGAPDTDFGFFIIADGADRNDFSSLDLENGTLSFVYMKDSDHERAATIYDPANKIWLIYSDGTQEVVLKGANGPNGIYHTTLRDGETNLNHDGKVHVVSGLVENGDHTSLRIGFEDQKHTGDADYNDVVFDITVHSTSGDPVDLPDDGNNYLDGGAGNDILYGGTGDDILIGGAGADTLYGGLGADQFVFTVLDGFVDIVKDFTAAEGDILNITDILQGYDELTDLLSDFVRLTQNGADTQLEVNASGDPNGSFAVVAIIEGGVGNATLADLIDNGNLVANQSAVV